MDIPLGPLRAFHLVVGHQNFSKAARHLGITQPAVSQQIRRLERAVGHRLFLRDGRRLVLTETGQTLEAFAGRIVQLVDAARDALDRASDLQTGHLKMGASRTAGAYYVAGILDRFKRRYPSVRVSLSVGNSQTIVAGILDFTLHAGLVAGRPESPHLVSRPLIRDRMCVVLPPRHPLARRAVLSVADLRACPMVLREPGSSTRHLVEQAFAASGLTVEPSMELESNEAIKSAVADGIGVAVMAHAAVAQDLASGRLVGRRLRDRLSLDFALVYHRDRVLSPVLSSFLATLPRRARAEQEFPAMTGSIRPA
jgi:DNA-binding transcriptional LysR family regulator